MNYCLQKYNTHQFTYFIYYLFQDNFKNAKSIKIQQVHHEIHTKLFFLILFKLFSIGDSFKSKANQENATDLVTRQCYSRENAKEIIVTSPHVMARPIVSRIANANPKRESEHITRT